MLFVSFQNNFQKKQMTYNGMRHDLLNIFIWFYPETIEHNSK